MRNTAVIGAGITGLTLAHELKRKGAEVTVFEAAGHCGGAIRTVNRDGFLIEAGPNSVLAGGETWDHLMDSLGLCDELVEANSAAQKRYIARDGRMVALPSSPIQFFTSDFLSPSGKIRLLAEPFVRQGTGVEDESLAGFARRRFGQEALDYLFNPFVCGIYAGRPEDLSVRHAFPMLSEAEKSGGSVTAGILGKLFRRGNKPRSRKKMVSFKEGMQTLPLKLAEHLGQNLKLGITVSSLARAGCRWKLGLKSGESAGLFDSVVMTIPAHQLAGIDIPGLGLDIRRTLADVPYAPVRVWHFGFLRKGVTHPLDGFGLLLPEKENKITLGVIFSSTLFPGRSSDGRVLLTVFSGGARNPGVMNMQSAELQDIVLREIDSYLGITEKPVFASETIWPRAIPQMIPGYGRFLDAMEAAEKELTELYLAGSYRGGISVLNCIENGINLAGRLH